MKTFPSLLNFSDRILITVCQKCGYFDAYAIYLKELLNKKNRVGGELIRHGDDVLIHYFFTDNMRSVCQRYIECYKNDYGNCNCGWVKKLEIFTFTF